ARYECGRSDIRAIAQNWNCRQHHQDIANARWQHDRDYPRETTLPFNRSGADRAVLNGQSRPFPGRKTEDKFQGIQSLDLIHQGTSTTYHTALTAPTQ